MNRRAFIKKAGIYVAAPAIVGFALKKSGSGHWLPVGNNTWLLAKEAPVLGASTIISRSPGGVVDKRIQLAASQFGRALPSITGGWTKIRLGVRMQMAGSASVNGGCVLAVGLCSGTTNMVLDATTTHYLGWLQTQNMTYVAGDATYQASYNFGVNQMSWYSKKGTTYNLEYYGTPGAFGFGADPNYTGTMWFLEIAKGANYTFEMKFKPYSITKDLVVNQSDFLGQVAVASPSFTNHTNGSSASTFAYNDSAGALDTVNIAWSRADATFEISDLAVVKIA